MRKYLFILVLTLATLAQAGTVTGKLTTATGGNVVNGTLSFTLSQTGIIPGSSSVVPSTVSCYTDGQGNVVGVPDPLVLPIVATNTASGTLAAGTYYVEVSYTSATGETVASSEQAIALASTGSLIISAPIYQPASATGYKVYISAASGTETLQGSVTGWGNFTQSSALANGASPLTTNSTACKLTFSDELIPTGTYYTVNLTNRNGSQMAGFTQTWCTYGGSGGTINVSNGMPTGNCSSQGVYYPSPVYSNQSNTWPLAQTFKQLNGMCSLDQWAPGSTTGGAAEAMAAGCRMLFVPQKGSSCTVTATTPITVTANNVSFFGPGTFCVNHTSDFITISGLYFEYNVATTQIATALNRGTSSLFKLNSTQAFFTDNSYIGNSSSSDNGRVFTALGNGGAGTSGAVLFTKPYLQEGYFWHNWFYIQNASAASSSASYYIDGALGGAKFVDNCITLDGFLDTIQFNGGGCDEESGSTGGDAIAVSNVTPNATGDPRWIHFLNFTIESGGISSGRSAINVSKGRDVQYCCYIANSQVGVTVGAGAVETDIHNTVFAGIGRQCILIKNGSILTQISENKFDDCADSADATYPVIGMDASANFFAIIGNTARNINGISKPTYFIDFGASAGNYKVIGNTTGAATWRSGILHNECLSSSAAVFGNGDARDCTFNSGVGFLFGQTIYARGGIQNDSGSNNLTLQAGTGIVEVVGANTMKSASFTIGSGTPITAQTGTGGTVAMSTSPVLVTPNIGAATATSVTVGANTVPVVATPTAGQAACIFAAGPPVQIGKCTSAVGAGGACTCAQ